MPIGETETPGGTGRTAGESDEGWGWRGSDRRGERVERECYGRLMSEESERKRGGRIGREGLGETWRG